MIKAIQYATTGTQNNSRRKGNYLIGESTVSYGPTSETGFYNSIIPPEGGYTLYLNKATGGPSIYVFSGNTELLNFCNSNLGANQTDIFGTIDWINTQDDYYVDPNYFHFTQTTVSEGSFSFSLNYGEVDFEIDWGDGSAIETITTSGNTSHTYPVVTGGTGGGTNIIPDIFGATLYEPSYLNSAYPSYFFMDSYGDPLPTINVGDTLIIGYNGQDYETIVTSIFYADDYFVEGEIQLQGSGFLSIDPYSITLTLGGGAASATYDVKIAGKLQGFATILNPSINDIKSWGCMNITTLSSFGSASNLTCSAVDSPRITTTNLAGMFNGCTNFNGAIGNWDVSSVTNMASMFTGANLFNQPIGNWNVSNVIIMQSMFNGSSFNQDIGSWNVSNVTDMSNMFLDCEFFNQDIGNWNVSNVTNMTQMFRGESVQTQFNQDIGNWDVSSVVDMDSMFAGANLFNQDIGNWNVSNVTNMYGMFNFADSFNQDIGRWDVSNVTIFSDEYTFFSRNSNYSHLDSIYNNWSQLDVVNNRNFSWLGAKYSTEGAAGRQSLINNDGWTIYDGGQL